jgi:hypothetical protein
MFKNIIQLFCITFLLSMAPARAMEQDVLRRVAEGGLQAQTLNVMFPNAILHEHARAEQVTINQFNQEHYNQRQPFFDQIKGSIGSGFLQAGFDTANLPGYFGKVLVAAAAQTLLTMVIAKVPDLYNRIFRAKETEMRKKTREAQLSLSHLAVENQVINNLAEQIKLLPQQTKEQKNKQQEMQQLYQKLFESHMRRAAQYVENYGAVLPKAGAIAA